MARVLQKDRTERTKWPKLKLN